MPFKLMPYQKEIDIIGFYTAFRAKYEKNYQFAGERHNFWELVYILEGTALAVAEKTGIILKEGDIIFHKPMEFHALSSDKEHEFTVLIVSFETSSTMTNFFSNKIFHLNHYQKDIIKQFLNILGNSFSDSSFGDYQTGIALIEQLLIQIYKNNNPSIYGERISCSAKRNIEKALIASIKNFIKKNIYSNITLSDICNEFNMSKSYISHLFKREVGKSVMDYYIYEKIQQAKRLIQSDMYNITEISEKLCYTSLHNFSRSFKNKTGISPAAYKKILK